MSTTLSKQENNNNDAPSPTQQWKKRRIKGGDKAKDVGVSMYEKTIKQIDAIRGDTNRSLWIRRAVHNELERLKIKEKEEQRNENQKGVRGTVTSQNPANTNTYSNTEHNPMKEVSMY